MSTPALPPPPDAPSWVAAYSSATTAVIATLGLLAAVAGSIWKFMVSPLRAKINAAHTRINETNTRIDKLEMRVEKITSDHTDEHIANLGRLAGIELKLAALPTKEDFDEMRREQREDARQQVLRIDAVLRRDKQ